jgi:hypothetical protein
MVLAINSDCFPKQLFSNFERDVLKNITFTQDRIRLFLTRHWFIIFHKKWGVSSVAQRLYAALPRRIVLG